MRALIAAFVLSALAAGSAAAQQNQPPPLPPPFPPPEAKELLAESAANLMRALQLIIQAIPVYDPPVVTPDGDIVIRRRRNLPPPEPCPQSRPGEPPCRL